MQLPHVVQCGVLNQTAFDQTHGERGPRHSRFTGQRASTVAIKTCR